MRKPKDLDAELKALEDRARSLKERKIKQLGELVIATGADALEIEVLAGGLLVLAQTSEPQRKEGWRKRGAGFFQGKDRQSGDQPASDPGSPPPNDGGQASA